MKTKTTLRNLFGKKENYLIFAMLGLLFVFGCYEFSLIDQPTEATTDSSFEVNLVMKEDAATDNDWTSEIGDMTKTGFFGVLIPEGWTVTDNIAVRVESKDADLNGSGVEVTSTSDHAGDYTLAYNTGEVTRLTDTVGAPTGYVWWGARTTTPVDMAFFDSLYFTITVNTDDQIGDFYLQYTIGDEDYWERNPVHYKSEPMQITITEKVGVNELLTKDAISLYPNPSYGNLNITLSSFNGQKVDLMVYDMSGRQIISHKITNAHTMLDIVDFEPGTYVIRLKTGEEVLTQKFQKL